MRAVKMPALLMVAAAAVVVPLYVVYGDSRTVTHPDWARMLVRALDLESGLPEDATPAQLFSALSWKGGLVFAADNHERATGIAFNEGGAPTAVATEAEGELVYPLTVITGGDYRVRARMAGTPDRPAVVEFLPAGETAPSGTVPLAPTAIMGWVDGGTLHLDRGAYSAVVRLPSGASLEMIEVAPPCISPVEPLRGWVEDAIADSEDVAVTVIKAIDQESELPPAAVPIEVTAESFEEESTGPPMMVSAAELGAGAGLQGMWMRGGPGPRRAVVFIDLPEAGLYTISVYGLVGSGQGWSADACRKAIVCAAPDLAEARLPKWRTLMTAPFTAGRHSFTVTLRDDAAVQRLRAEQKKNTGPDYVATLRRLGLDVGDAGPVSRAKAEEAEDFVKRRAVELLASRCGDIILGDVVGLQPASIAGPGITPVQPGTGPNPVTNPPVPLDVPSPTPPPTTPSAPPSEPPASPTPPATPPPTPVPTPTPSPIPTQPPGSAITPTPGPNR